MSDYAGPLSRFTVLDLTRVRSGPTAVRQFADWGANVIKIEAPEAVDTAKGMGGARSGPDFQSIHRNKRSLTLNLKEPEALAIFLKMVETADVVVENFRPDVKDRLGISYEDLKKVNKGIVLLSISGFGQDGPYQKRPGFDQIAQGMGGLMSITGLPGQGPVRAGIPIADLTAGMYGAMGVMIALLEREASGEGQWVQTSLLQAMVAMLDFQAARYLIKGEVAGQAGNNHPTSIPTGVFKTSDGYINIAAAGDQMWDRICALFGDDEITNNPDFATGELRSKNRDAVNAALEKHTVTYTSDGLIEALIEASVPCGPINTIDKIFDDPQVNHLNLRHPVESKTHGKMDLLAQAVMLSRFDPKYGMATPERGEHTDDILKEYGYSDEQIAEFRDKVVV
ncbi:MAG: CoA transferase [Rhodospirillales bacterium]|nr:CoA transferase [Rhodospirillales bacterium]